MKQYVTKDNRVIKESNTKKKTNDSKNNEKVVNLLKENGLSKNAQILME